MATKKYAVDENGFLENSGAPTCLKYYINV